MDQAGEVIRFVNERFHRGWLDRTPAGEPTSTAKIIMERLKDGYTVGQCKQVAMRKFKDWGHSDRMAKFLRPSTLYRKSKFEEYLGECV